MKVALDVSHLNHEKLSGIGVYTLELWRSLQNLENMQVNAVYRPSRWKHRRFFKMHVGDGAKPWIAGGFGLHPEILHGPDFRVSKTKRAARVASIMDLAFLHPGMTSPEFAKKKTRDLCEILDDQTPDALIAISEATRRDLVAFRPKLEDRIHTVLLAGNHFAAKENTGSVHPRPYFLFVGNLEARKNVLGIIHAFERFCRNSSDTDLILIGKPGFEGERILEAVRSSPQQKRIHVLGYCNLSELQTF